MLAKSEWKAEGENLSYEPITDIISTPDSVQKWVHLTLADGKTIDATEGHPFNTPEGWRDAVLLKKGGELILKGEHGEPKSIQIAEVKVEDRRLTTYNLEVANAHTFFVGEGAVLVHNAKTSHTITQSGKHPNTSSPNSIMDTQRADGSRSITYYDDLGRAFSREDYGQLSPHDLLGTDANGRCIPHEHRFDYNDRGFPIKQDMYRPLDMELVVTLI